MRPRDYGLVEGRKSTATSSSKGGGGSQPREEEEWNNKLITGWRGTAGVRRCDRGITQTHGGVGQLIPEDARRASFVSPPTTCTCSLFK